LYFDEKNLVAGLDFYEKIDYYRSVKNKGRRMTVASSDLAKELAVHFGRLGGYFFLLFQSSSITMKVSIEITKVQKLSTSSIILCIRFVLLLKKIMNLQYFLGKDQ
jgi:hypothetical protein